MGAAPEPVTRVAAVMRGSGVTWSLCGGWAVDAWLGRQTRDHLDVDVAVFRDHERRIFEHLGARRLVAHDTADASHTDRWDGRPLLFPAHIHAAFDDGLEWELHVNERSRRDWVLSRAPRVVAPLHRFVQESAWDLPTVAPEIVLWYKALDVRPHDGRDFVALLPLLDGPRRTWLRDAIRLRDPAHRWLERLTG